MNFPFYIARRYLFRKKGSSSNAINILSGISILGMSIGTMALVVILSVFNGFEDLILSMYNTYSPDLHVSAKKGKTFVPTAEQLGKIEALPGVKAVSQVIEENALLRYEDKEVIATLKGVDQAYLEVSEMDDSAMVEGQFRLEDSEADLVVLGAGIEYSLGVDAATSFNPISIFAPKRGKVNILDAPNAVNRRVVYPAGVFAVQQEVDNKYAYISIDVARQLLDYDNEVTALEIAATPESSVSDLHTSVSAILGEEFRVRNRLQQDEELFRVLNSEKWVIYMILTLVLIIATFNMVGALSMLALEKAADIGVLKAMGAAGGTIKRIFFYEGILQVIIGYGIGVVLALAITISQIQYGWYKLEGAFRVDAYPVSLRPIDFLLVLVTVFVIGLLASWIPARKAAEGSMSFRPAA